MLHQKSLRMALLVCLGLVAAGLYGSAAEQKDRPAVAAASALARRDAAKEVYEGAWQRHFQEPESVAGDVGYFRDWSVRWLQAERDLGQSKAEQVTACDGHLKRMQSWKDLLEAQFKERQVPKYSVSAAEFFRLEAEDWLTAARTGTK